MVSTGIPMPWIMRPALWSRSIPLRGRPLAHGQRRGPPVSSIPLERARPKAPSRLPMPLGSPSSSTPGSFAAGVPGCAISATGSIPQKQLSASISRAAALTRVVASRLASTINQVIRARHSTDIRLTTPHDPLSRHPQLPETSDPQAS